MAERYLDRVYGLGGAPETQRALYDDWAASYDAELAANGYATPGRIAAALADLAPDRTRPILDFGCGTGISGAALQEAGFTAIDGCDLSEGMLAQARARGIYRRLWTIGAEGPGPGTWSAVVACGVVSPGAAPASTLALLAAALVPGGLLAFSFNDHVDAAPEYAAQVEALVAEGLEPAFRAHGPHLPKIGLGATVFVLRRPA